MRNAYLCPTSKMSHDHSRHDSCGLRLYSRWIHSIVLSLARGMTAVVVGSGALFGLFLRNSVSRRKNAASGTFLRAANAKMCSFGESERSPTRVDGLSASPARL